MQTPQFESVTNFTSLSNKYGNEGWEEFTRNETKYGITAITFEIKLTHEWT